MKKLEHKQAGVELHERCRRWMTESAIGFASHTREIGVSNAATDKGTDHVNRDFGVRLACKACDRLAIERGPGIRNIESTVASKTREHHLDKIERGGFAPC